MPVWLISWIVFCTFGLALPTILLLVAWRRSGAISRLMITPLLAIFILAVSMNHDVRWILIGADYTRRLYFTILTFTVLALLNAIVAATRRAWMVTTASAVISLAWFFVGIVNSAV